MGRYAFRGYGIEVHVERILKPSHDAYGRWTYAIAILIDPDDPESGEKQEVAPQYYNTEQEAERAGRLHGEEIIREKYV